MTRPRALISWSSGKDSAFALHAAREAGELEVVGLLTTVTTAFGRGSMHGVRVELPGGGGAGGGGGWWWAGGGGAPAGGAGGGGRRAGRSGFRPWRHGS